MFQRDRWQWRDGSTSTSFALEKQYEGFEVTTLTENHNTSWYTKDVYNFGQFAANISEIQLMNYTTDQDVDWCTVGNIIPGSTKITLSVINCSKPMSLYTFCMKKVQGSYDEDIIRSSQRYGYSFHLHNQSQILAAKYHCGEFTHLIENTCLKIIHFKHVIDYQPCKHLPRCKSSIPKIHQQQFCLERAKTVLHVHKQLDAVCGKAANVSVYHTTAYLYNTYASWINKFVIIFFSIKSGTHTCTYSI